MVSPHFVEESHGESNMVGDVIMTRKMVLGFLGKLFVKVKRFLSQRDLQSRYFTI